MIFEYICIHENCNLAIYILGALISSGINVILSCTLTWMVHSSYEVPAWLMGFVKRFLGRLSIPVKKSKVIGEINEALALIREYNRQIISQNLAADREASVAGEIKNNDETIDKQGKVNRVPNLVKNAIEIRAVIDENGIEEIDAVMQSVKKNLLYWALEEMKTKLDNKEIAKEKWKALAVILNRFSGIIIAIANIVLLLITGLVMFA